MRLCYVRLRCSLVTLSYVMLCCQRSTQHRQWGSSHRRRAQSSKPPQPAARSSMGPQKPACQHRVSCSSSCPRAADMAEHHVYVFWMASMLSGPKIYIHKFMYTQVPSLGVIHEHAVWKNKCCFYVGTLVLHVKTK